MKLNNVVKKTLAGVMVAAMIVTPIPEVGNVNEVYAAESNEDYFEYDVENNLVTIAGYVGEDTQVKIPSEIEGKKVVCIGDSAFLNNSTIKEVTIPDSVTSIDYDAFYNCSSLQAIDIPNSITSIEQGAFFGCSSLTEISIPASVTKIGYGAFAYCSNLASIKVDEANEAYDSRENCNAIIRTSVNNFMFGCKSSVIPDSVTIINTGAFLGCSGITSMSIPDDVIKIGNSAFYNCGNLTSISIPESVTSIEVGVFTGSKLQKVYYSGSQYKWNRIVIEEHNDILINADIQFALSDPDLVPITKAKITGIADETYTGKSHTQSKLVVKLGSKVLKSGTDYTVTYKNNKAVGKALVTITGKNAYTGTITKTFDIAPRQQV